MESVEKKEHKDESKQVEKKEVKKKIGRPPLVKSNTAKFKKEIKNVIIDFFKFYRTTYRRGDKANIPALERCVAENP